MSFRRENVRSGQGCDCSLLGGNSQRGNLTAGFSTSHEPEKHLNETNRNVVGGKIPFTLPSGCSSERKRTAGARGCDTSVNTWRPRGDAGAKPRPAGARPRQGREQAWPLGQRCVALSPKQPWCRARVTAGPSPGCGAPCPSVTSSPNERRLPASKLFPAVPTDVPVTVSAASPRQAPARSGSLSVAAREPHERSAGRWGRAANLKPQELCAERGGRPAPVLPEGGPARGSPCSAVPCAVCRRGGTGRRRSSGAVPELQS